MIPGYGKGEGEMETRKRLLVIPAALLVIPVYIFLHELGHLLVMVACGD